MDTIEAILPITGVPPEMFDALCTLREQIITCYANRQSHDDFGQLRVAEFINDLTIENKTKYIKIICRDSVWGFIIKNDDNKFKSGDILMAASWNGPRRNAARGNIFTKYSIDWMGPTYLT